jgi:glycosyltransferase involved in cell wall biosynthesis
VALPNAFVAVDSNWESSREIYTALSAHVPGLLVEAREWRQAWRAGWLRSGQLRLQRLNQALWRKRYALPTGWFHSLNYVSMPLLGRSITRQSVDALGGPPRVWIFSSPYYLRLLEKVQPEFAVYHPVDDYRWYWPRLAARTTYLEAAMVSLADLVVCVSRYNRDRLQRMCPDNPGKVVHVPNGAPERFYQEPDNDLVARWRARLAAFPQPFFAYIGDPVKRIDAELVGALAAATAGTILFAGPARLPMSLCQQGNARALGPIPGDEIPAFLRVVDVLLIPQVDSEFNRAASPRKLWEYCTSGKPIVGACLTEVDPCLDGIRVAETADEFVRHALDSAAGHDALEARAARARIAEQHRYPALALRYLAYLLERWQTHPHSSRNSRPDVAYDAGNRALGKDGGSFGTRCASPMNLCCRRRPQA